MTQVQFLKVYKMKVQTIMVILFLQWMGELLNHFLMLEKAQQQVVQNLE